MTNNNLPQCQTCVFNKPNFVEYCKTNATETSCSAFQEKITVRCSACNVTLDSMEWFVFGDKCAICGIEDLEK